MESNFKEKWFAFWRYMFGAAKKEMTKQNDYHILTENSVQQMIVDLLSKKGTQVSMGPRSNVYIIINGNIRILIDGSRECVRARVVDANHVWNFRGSYITKLIDLTIDWIEEDRQELIIEFFESDIAIVNEFNRQISKIETKIKPVEHIGHVVYD